MKKVSSKVETFWKWWWTLPLVAGRSWWTLQGTILRPPDYESGALTN